MDLAGLGPNYYLVPLGKAEASPLPHLYVTKKGDRATEMTLRRRPYGWVRESRIKKFGIDPNNLERTCGPWYPQENSGQLIEPAELIGHSNLPQVRKYALSDAERSCAGVAKL